MSKLLINESPLLIQPSLAKVIGLHEAIFLQQLHYWMGVSRFIKNERKWVYNTYEQWLEQLKYLSLPTLKRAIKSLKIQKLLYVERLDKVRSNQVNYYSINYDALNQIEKGMTEYFDSGDEGETLSDVKEIRVAQVELKEDVKMSSSRIAQDEPIYTREYQETTHKIHHKTGLKKISADIKKQELPKNVDRDLWIQFVEMRQGLKKPLTESAAHLLIKKLESFGEYANQSLENSIIASYQSVYPPQETKFKTSTTGQAVKRFGRSYANSNAQEMVGG